MTAQDREFFIPAADLPRVCARFGAQVRAAFAPYFPPDPVVLDDSPTYRQCGGCKRFRTDCRPGPVGLRCGICRSPGGGD